ncbi:hypothetical protein [Photobacterium chitinilyticum]|uniref:hypothetical protein n=1 Tax=Photobacterium chitinilyticum TaxID=2485123 RepID=UPI0013E8BB10|nr:hypothetical protein [Photobacterium chitinilyticum]
MSKTINQQIKDAIHQREAEGVKFSHAPKSKINASLKNVLKKHRSTIKELADR